MEKPQKARRRVTLYLLHETHAALKKEKAMQGKPAGQIVDDLVRYIPKIRILEINQ
jgi:hypothetical protein